MKTLSDTHKKNISDAMRTPVQYIPTGEIFKSTTEAAKQFDVSRRTVIRHCKEAIKKQQWRYYEGNF